MHVKAQARAVSLAGANLANKSSWSFIGKLQDIAKGRGKMEMHHCVRLRKWQSRAEALSWERKQLFSAYCPTMCHEKSTSLWAP